MASSAPILVWSTSSQGSLTLSRPCLLCWMGHCCKRLRHLSLSNCDTGMLSAWKIRAIRAPGSHLAVFSLELVHLLPGKLEVLHLPKLERLCWDGWICRMAHHMRSCSRVQAKHVLRGSTALQDLTLSFQGESLWLMTRGKTTLRCVQQTEEVITSWHIHQVWYVKDDDSSWSSAIRWYRNHGSWCACASTVALIYRI